MKSILDSSFHYTPSSQTDVSKTFARWRNEHAQATSARVYVLVARANRLPAKPLPVDKVNKA